MTFRSLSEFTGDLTAAALTTVRRNPVNDPIAQAIAEPGTVVPRGHGESTVRWAARAVRKLLADGIATNNPAPPPVTVNPPDDLTPLVDECARRCYLRLPSRAPGSTFDDLPQVQQHHLRSLVLPIITDVIDITHENGAHQ